MQLQTEVIDGLKTLLYNGSKFWNVNRKEKESWKCIIILEGVEVIPHDAFVGCINVRKVIFADSVKRIEYCAFDGCLRLIYIKFPFKLEYIGKWAFRNCKSITSVFIPRTCKQLDRCAFIGCSNLLIFNIANETVLKEEVISETKLADISPVQKEKINSWLKNRLAGDHYALHRLCCSEDPDFKKFRSLITEENCCIQDDCGLTALHYLIANHSASVEMIGQLIQSGGRALLLKEDSKGKNILQHAIDNHSSPTVIKMLVQKGGKEISVGVESTKYEELIKATILIQDYMRKLRISPDSTDINTLPQVILALQPAYTDIEQVLRMSNIPSSHCKVFKDYCSEKLKLELANLTERQEKVPLLRSTITIVGRGRAGKTSTINSLKMLPFNQLCQSTKGTSRSEVEVIEDCGVGISEVCVGSTNLTSTAFLKVDRDCHSSSRAAAKHIVSNEVNGESSLFSESIDDADLNTAPDSDKSKDKKSFISKVLTIPKLHKKKKKNRKMKPLSILRKKMHEMDLKEENGNDEDLGMDIRPIKDEVSVRFTVFDNGGQEQFRCIQNLILSRNGVYIVVFNIINLIGDNKKLREESLEHLQYWLSSIMLHACKEDSDDSIDPSIRYPPVILIGTHYDKFLELEGDCVQLLRNVDKVLTNLIATTQSEKLFCDERKLLYNEEQGISFWPVDNCNPKDSNIIKLRKLILEATIIDKGFDVEELVPISVLQAMDKLTEISEEQQILPLVSEDTEDASVVSVMKQCGVFKDSRQNEMDDVEICKLILRRYHSIGHFLYFHQVPSLGDFCILDPQWLLNMITYIVRDFRYHWFLRDKRAIQLNDGQSWKRLKNCGLLDIPLLHQLWVGGDQYFDFLRALLIEIGIFGKIGTTYTVPIVCTKPSSENIQVSKDRVKEHLDEEHLFGEITLPNHVFLLVPFYCALANVLVSACESQPIFLSSGCNLCFGEVYKYSLILDTVTEKISIFIPTRDKSDETVKSELASLISSSYQYVNEVIYTGRLQLNLKLFETGSAMPYSTYIEEVKASHRIGTFRNQSKVSLGTQNNEGSLTVFDACWKAMIQKRWIRNQYNDFVTLFKQDMNRKKSEHIAKSIIKADSDVTIYTLLNWFYEDKDELDELLKELGIEHRTDRRKITSILANLEKPEKAEPYLIARIDEEEFEDEQNIIRYKLLSSNYKGYFCVENDLSDIHAHLDKNDTFKVLHFGLHKSTLEASDFNILLKENTSTSNIQCFVFNSCKSEEVLKLAKEHLYNHNLIYWDSKVDDYAALRFSEEFYGRLCSRREKASEFEEIFEQAKKAMEAHDFVFDDPAKRKDGVGILKFWNGQTSMDLEYADQTASSKVDQEPSVSKHYDKKKRKLNDIDAIENYEICRTAISGDKKDYNCKQPYFCDSSKTINWCSQKNYNCKSSKYCSNCKVGFCTKVRTGCGGKSCFEHHLQTTVAIKDGVCRMENGTNEFKNGSAPRKSEFSVIGGHQCYPILVDEVKVILDSINEDMQESDRKINLETGAELIDAFDEF